MNRPGGNFTGFVYCEASVFWKHVEVLLEAVPQLKKLVVIHDGRNSANCLRTTLGARGSINIDQAGYAFIASSPTDVAPVLLKDADFLRFSAHCGPIPVGIDKWPFNRRWTAGRAVLDKTLVHVLDLRGPEGEEFPDGRELSLRMGHRTILSVPLMREGESIGAIVLRRGEVNPFSDKQVELLKTFADQAVIAFEHARLFDEVQARTIELTHSLEQLRATPGRLIQSGKLASLGQLTAGIAHEIKNPLNFVNNFAALVGLSPGDALVNFHLKRLLNCGTGTRIELA